MKESFYHVLQKGTSRYARAGLVIEAHPDDTALGSGILELLAPDTRLTALTLTDGGGRTIAGLTQRELIKERKHESKKSLGISGFADMYHAGLPDGQLASHALEGMDFVQRVIKNRQPEFIMVTHNEDMHPDHAAAANIAVAAAATNIPVYFMDTVTGLSGNNTPITYSHAISLPFHAVQRRDHAYRAHRSQVTNLSENEMVDVRHVLKIPKKRGKEHGKLLAGVLLHANPETNDIVKEVLGEQIIFERKLAAA